jgi:CBS domain-containing protein
MKVRDVMTAKVLSTTPQTPLREAALMLAREGVSGMPVLDEDGVVVGVFSEADVIAKEGLEPHRGGLLGWLVEPADRWLEDRLAATTVADAMSAPPVTIGPDRPLAEAATLMLDEGVNRLPVVDEGKLVGLVSRADLVRAFVRTDAEIKEEIEQEAIRRTLWLDPADVTVTVENGHVTLTGAVSTETDAELLRTFVRRVPGVIDVTSEVAVGETAG